MIRANETPISLALREDEDMKVSELIAALEREDPDAVVMQDDAGQEAPSQMVKTYRQDPGRVWIEAGE